MAVAMRGRWYTCADAVSCSEARAMSGHLTLANGTKVPVHHGFTLGRVAGCDLVLDDGKASRKHARIHVESGVVEIEDLQSSNGTLLNDKPVTRRLLRDGDRIQIGKTVVVYHEGDLPVAPPRAAVASREPAGPVREPAPARGAVLDDNDLFGDADATQIAAAPPPPPPPVAPRAAAPSAPPSPAARTEPPSWDAGARAEPPGAEVVQRARPPVPQPSSPPSSQPSSPPRASAPQPPPPLPPSSVVEFADEVVEVRRPAAPPAAARATSAPAGPVVSAPASRVLQFQKQGAGKGGLLGDDMGQMTGAMRGLLVLAVLAGGAGVVWLIVQLLA
jgi:predicted component of type VI protein secretion system